MARRDESENPVLKQYMKELRRRMFWMSGEKKKVLLEDTQAHLQDIAGDIKTRNRDKAYAQAIERFGTPREHAAEYKYLYGYGMKFLILMIVLAVIFSALTIPAFSNLPPIGEAKETLQTMGFCCGAISIIFLLLTFTVIIFAGVKAGRWHGLAVGGAAFLSRTITMMIVIVFWGIINRLLSNALGDIGNVNLAPTGCQVCGLIFVSILMPVAGFVAGRGIKSLRKGELFKRERPGTDVDDEDEELELF
jgi:hypothetical protein